MLGRATPLLCGCHNPVGDRIWSSVVGMEVPRSFSKLLCEVGGTRALLLGHELLWTPPQVLSTKMYDCVMFPATWCVHPQSLLIVAPGIISVMGVPIISSDVPQAWMHCSGPKTHWSESFQSYTPVPDLGAWIITLNFSSLTSMFGYSGSLKNPW